MKSAVLLILLLASPAFAKKHKNPELPPPTYIPAEIQEVHTIGSLWSDQGILSDMSKDYKAHKVNDIVMIRILEKTDATATGQVKTSRQFAANASITNLAGKLSAANNLQKLLDANSSNSLNGQGASTSN